MQHTPIRIEKEQLPLFRFRTEEVLKHPQEIEQRRQRLEAAARLGNEHKEKVRLVFQAQEGLYEIYTTVWNAGEAYVSLKYGYTLPVRAVVDVQS